MLQLLFRDNNVDEDPYNPTVEVIQEIIATSKNYKSSAGDNSLLSADLIKMASTSIGQR